MKAFNYTALILGRSYTVPNDESVLVGEYGSTVELRTSFWDINNRRH